MRRGTAASYGRADSLGHTWIATACQGTGASIWWPNKDTQADEPDSQRVVITVPDSLKDVSNGRLRAVSPNGDGTTTLRVVRLPTDQQL